MAPRVARLETSAYRYPTDAPEADGTFQWDGTVVVIVEAVAESGERGLGFSYTAASAAGLIHEMLEEVVKGVSASEPRRANALMVNKVRNVGRAGLASTAISAVDVALWDLWARVRGMPLVEVLGQLREAVPIYGSGGFTSYSDERLANQLGGWVQQGIPRVKMKIGTDWGTEPERDLQRIRVAREAIGPDADLFVDANGAYTVKQAVEMAPQLAELGVTYFEEPVSSDHLDQLAFVREHMPMSVAAGEYAYDPWYIRDMLGAKAVDIIQADVTRCLGITGWLEAAAVAHGFAVPFSGHTSPTLHATVGCAAPEIAHIEYFHDHVRLENTFFDGVPQPCGGRLAPERSAPGMGLTLKRADVERYRVA